MTRPADTSSYASAQAGAQVKLACRNIWKLYGKGAAELLAARGGTLSAAELAEFNLIGAVRNCSVSVREGEILIVMGLSGSGKSTLIRCLSRLIEPTAGEVVFDGGETS